MNLKGKSLTALESFFLDIDEPRYRALQAFRRIHKHLAPGLDDFSEFPLSLREKLKASNTIDSFPKLSIQHQSKLAKDGTCKFIYTCPDKKRGTYSVAKERQIETVWLPTRHRRTICISSQVGCSLSCDFCATGTLAFRGNLECWEILEQVYETLRIRQDSEPQYPARPSQKAFQETLPGAPQEASQDTPRPLTNVVFMGMGEPFHNYEQVMQAAHILNHPHGLHIGARHITISTAGVIPSIERFIRNKEPFNLAISLNHTNQEDRSQIMGISRKYPLDKLLNVARKFTKELDRRITFEYVMIPNVNMRSSDVDRLISISRSVRCHVNLIPLNTQFHGWQKPSSFEIAEFKSRLLAKGVLAFERGSPGLDIDAACGMLALKAN